MHELGIIHYVGKSLARVAEENHVTRIGRVTMEIGEVSGIVPDYLLEYWDYYCDKTELLKDSELRLEIIGAVTYCEDCEKTYETKKYGKTCPYCQSPHTYLIAGNECTIKEVAAFTEEASEGEQDLPEQREEGENGSV